MTSSADPLRLPTRSRAWRLMVLGLVVGLLTYGSVTGQDDMWPFGPLRMYATSSAATGSVSVVAIQVRDPAGRWVDAPLDPRHVGMNRAEVEGRIGRIEAEPRLLGELAAAHSRLRPEAPAWTALRVVRRSAPIVDRRPTGATVDTVLMTWTAP